MQNRQNIFDTVCNDDMPTQTKFIIGSLYEKQLHVMLLLIEVKHAEIITTTDEKLQKMCETSETTKFD